MTVIHVAIHEGFQNDSLVVYLAEAEVYRRTGLTTRMQIGLADSFELETVAGKAELRVEVPTRNAGVTIPVEVPTAGELHIGISITSDGRIAYRNTDEPFRYA